MPSILVISGHGLAVQFAGKFGNHNDPHSFPLPPTVTVKFISREGVAVRDHIFSRVEDNPGSLDDRLVVQTVDRHSPHRLCPNYYLISSNPIDLDIHVVPPNPAEQPSWHQYIVRPGYYNTLEHILTQPYKCSTIQGKNWDRDHNPPIERGTVVDTDTAIPDLLHDSLTVIWCACRSHEVPKNWQDSLLRGRAPVG